MTNRAALRCCLYLAAGMLALAAVLYATRPDRCTCVLGAHGDYSHVTDVPEDCSIHGFLVD